MAFAIAAYGERLLDLFPDEVRAELGEALVELSGDATVLAREVAECERDELAFAEAARLFEQFPTMARVHFGMLDLLQLDLPRQQRDLARELAARAQQPAGDELRRNWFLAAARDDENTDDVVAGLMRFLLYQAVRMNVWVLTWDDGAPLEAAGVMRELDNLAEANLRRRLDMVEMRDPGVRPLTVLVAEAVEGVSRAWDQRRADLARSRPETVEQFHALTEASAVARRLGSGDAALLRNEIEGVTGGRKLDSRPLAERSPLALPSQNATDQRRKRLLAKLEREEVPEAKGERLVDLMRQESGS